LAKVSKRWVFLKVTNAVVWNTKFYSIFIAPTVIVHMQEQQVSDTTLLEKFYTDGNNHWLGVLLQRYTILLLGTCMKYLKQEEKAKDAVQQIFVKCLQEIPKTKIAYFKSWLYMVAKNHCLMQLRKPDLLLIEQNEFVGDDSFLTIEQAITKEHQLTQMENSLQLLNTEQKTCVTLFYLHKKSYTEIHEITGYSLLQIKSAIQNGKRNLKIMMEKQMKQPHGK
jgi:RNA polymerase sigma factor (sigma-70 family)